MVQTTLIPFRRKCVACITVLIIFLVRIALLIAVRKTALVIRSDATWHIKTVDRMVLLNTLMFHLFWCQ